MKYSECLPLYIFQIMYTFLNSSTSANYDKVKRLLANGGLLTKGVVSLL